MHEANGNRTFRPSDKLLIFVRFVHSCCHNLRTYVRMYLNESSINWPYALECSNLGYIPYQSF